MNDPTLGAGLIGSAHEQRHHTLASLFATRADADRAVEALVADGIARNTITVTDAGRAGGTSALSGERTTVPAAHDDGLWGALKRMFSADDDVEGYYEGINRGQTLVNVAVANEMQADHAATILERHNPIDLETQEAAWRQEGWTGGRGMTGSAAYAGSADLAGAAGLAATSGIGTSGLMADTTAGSTVDTTVDLRRGDALRSDTLRSDTLRSDSVRGGSEEVIPVTEERISIGKRDVSRGSVRVRAYTVERPFEEAVRLREEHVHIERRPVDRALSGTDAAFKDRVIEMTETSEEAVVQKSSRVVEEVVVHKDAGERTETVRDTLRRTEVEIEDTTGTRAATAPMGASSVKGGRI